MNVTHKLQQRKNQVDEFNKAICYIKCSIPEIVKCNDISTPKSDEHVLLLIKESLNRIKMLLNNSYFHFMFINNFVRKLILIIKLNLCEIKNFMTIFLHNK